MSCEHAYSILLQDLRAIFDHRCNIVDINFKKEKCKMQEALEMLKHIHFHEYDKQRPDLFTRLIHWDERLIFISEFHAPVICKVSEVKNFIPYLDKDYYPCFMHFSNICNHIDEDVVIVVGMHKFLGPEDKIMYVTQHDTYTFDDNGITSDVYMRDIQGRQITPCVLPEIV